VDHFIEKLLTLVNGTELEFPITLTVSGLVISGVLVNSHRYFEGFYFGKLINDGMLMRSPVMLNRTI
jgi:hypothetical protein